ncbi:hypothetical protein H4F83_24270 [Citrobacter freundii]|nr:hypothetical protein [Citrobacter freundii]
MNIDVLYPVGDIPVLLIISALSLSLSLSLSLPIVAIPMAYWLISLFCRFFFLLCLPAGDFPDGNRRCRKRSR